MGGPRQASLGLHVRNAAARRLCRLHRTNAVPPACPQWVSYNRRYRLGREGAWWSLPFDANLGLTFTGSPHIEIGLLNAKLMAALALGLLAAGKPLRVSRKEVSAGRRLPACTPDACRMGTASARAASCCTPPCRHGADPLRPSACLPACAGGRSGGAHPAGAGRQQARLFDAGAGACRVGRLPRQPACRADLRACWGSRGAGCQAQPAGRWGRCCAEAGTAWSLALHWLPPCHRSWRWTRACSGRGAASSWTSPASTACCACGRTTEGSSPGLLRLAPVLTVLTALFLAPVD